MKGYQLFVQFKGDAEVTTGDGWAFRHKANAEGYAKDFVQACAQGTNTLNGRRVEVEKWEVREIEAQEDQTLF